MVRKPLTNWAKSPEAGFLIVPLLLSLLVLSTASLGLWKLLRSWRKQAELQLCLDRCTQEAALGLKSRLIALENSSIRFRALKAALVLTAAHPATRAALELEKINQERLTLEWTLARWRWNASPCPGSGWSWKSGSSAYPEFPYRREPPDPMGPGNLVWSEQAHPNFTLHLHKNSRQSTALIALAPSSKGIPTYEVSTQAPSSWQARWVAGPFSR